MAMPFASLLPAADHHCPSPISRFCRPSPLYSSSFGEESPHQQQQQAHAMRWAARPAPFTAAQYEELEHQSLIYKYLVAGVPVLPDLLLPICRGFDSLASRFYHLPALAGWIHSPKTIYLASICTPVDYNMRLLNTICNNFI